MRRRFDDDDDDDDALVKTNCTTNIHTFLD